MIPSGPHPRFPHLFQPLRIKNVTLHNRIAISGHFAGWWVDDNGLPTDSFTAYVEERARGGVGLFVIGATSPMPGSGWLENISDAIIPRYCKIVEAGHRHGTMIFAQLCHPGFRPLPGPSIYKHIPSVEEPRHDHRRERHIPTIQELQELIRAFGAAAGRAAAGGVDGVELHSHESFLHAQMLNPIWNQRTDEYGGTLDNRMRFLVETLQAMRAAIPPEIPLGLRLKADDMEQRGMGPEDYREVLLRLDREGLADYVNFTGGDARLHHGPTPRPEGEWIPLVKEMRKSTRLPIMHAGRITTPEMAEQALAEGAVDMVCMTKTHIADPHFARKVWENRVEDIRFCTRCLRCHGLMHTMTCIYNPLTSRELAWSEIKPAAHPRRIVIVGAGPAGMEAALTAAQRGHQVILLERSSRVGGQIWTAAGSPLRQPFARIAEFYERQASKNLFELRLNTEATPGMILELRPDVVIIAAGSVPNRLQLPGFPTPPGKRGGQIYTVHEVIAGAADGASHAVVLDREGTPRAMVAADYLSSRGVQVDFVTPLRQVGPGMELMLVDEFVDHFRQRGVKFWPGQEIARWTEEGDVLLNSSQAPEAEQDSQPQNCQDLIKGVDTIVGLVGSTPVSTLASELSGLVPEIHLIGDANIPQSCEQAAYDGANLGRLL